MHDPIVTTLLVLVPIPVELAKAVLSGDLSSVTAGEGWPHADTLDGLRMAVEHRDEPGWLVTLDGVVIGDCGTFGDIDSAGDVEIGYGLAEPHRGNGYGTELIGALSQWLLGRVGVQRVVAKVLAENTASSRALERCGFQIDRADDTHSWYTLGR